MGSFFFFIYLEAFFLNLLDFVFVMFFPTKSIGNIDTIHSYYHTCCSSNLPSFNYFPNNGKSFTYALHTTIEPLSFSLKVHHLPALLSMKHKEVSVDFSQAYSHMQKKITQNISIHPNNLLKPLKSLSPLLKTYFKSHNMRFKPLAYT